MERDQVYFLDILQAARLALSYVKGMTKEAFLADIQCQDSVVRRIEIIGEASRRISDQMKALHPSVPWKEMINMRNLMIHDYDDVDMEIVWDTVQQDLPSLVALIEPLAPRQEA
ncbi:MAG: DUF86 domain-containing protein [Deltaproteobacteria bacterium]|nr:DUF86 domain-containing protein [Deltaproteobacteria bacterium]